MLDKLPASRSPCPGRPCASGAPMPMRRPRRRLHTAPSLRRREPG